MVVYSNYSRNNCDHKVTIRNKHLTSLVADGAVVIRGSSFDEEPYILGVLGKERKVSFPSVAMESAWKHHTISNELTESRMTC